MYWDFPLILRELIANKGITWLFSGILFICALVVSFAQINNISEKSHVIIIIINKQGQMISRMRVLIIQAKWIQSHFKSSCKCWLNKLLKNQLSPVNLFKITEKCVKSSINNRRITKLKQEPISCRADNTLAARCQSFAARWACVLKRPIFYLATYIDNKTCL